MTPPTAPAESFADSHAAFAADREAQFLELAAEIPDEGGEAPAVEAAPAPDAAAAPAKDETPALDAKPDAQADGAAAKTEPVVTDEPDPLANAKPFTYTVDREARPFEGIRVLADKDGKIEGAIVEPQAIQKLQDRLQRADFLEGQDKARYEKMREFESVTFKVGDVEHKGMAAVEQFATENAKLSAAVKLLASVLEDPEKLIPLAYAVQNNDTTEMARLTREIGLVAKEATWKARESWGQAQRQTVERAGQEQERSQITSQAITGAVQHWAQQHPALTKDDVEKAVAHFSRVGTSIVRPATPDEAKAAGVKPGELVIDHPVIFEWLKDRAELRAQQADATKNAQKAATENAAKLAATARGKKPTPAAPAKAAKEPAPKSKSEEWQDQKLRMMTGQFSETPSGAE